MKKRKRDVCRECKAVLFGLFLLIFIPNLALSEETYRFDQMWPTMTHPWYFYRPFAVAVDREGFVYIAEYSGDRVVKLDKNGSLITQWGTPGSGEGEFNYPLGIAVDSTGIIYVSDTANDRIQKFTSNGDFISAMGRSGSGPGYFDDPAGLAFDSRGNLYVTDQNNHRIQKFDSQGQFMMQWGNEGSGDGQFLSPAFIAIDSEDHVYVGERNAYPNYHVQKFTSDGVFITKWGPDPWVYDEYQNWNFASGIGIDKNDNVYIAWRPTLDKFSPDGQLLKTWTHEDGYYDGGGNIAFGESVFYVGGWDGVGKFGMNSNLQAWWSSSSVLYGAERDDKFHRPVGITLAGNGNMYVADFTEVIMVGSKGKFLNKWYAKPDVTYEYSVYPRDIAANSKGEIFVTVDVIHTFSDDHIQKRTSNGTLISRWGTGGTGPGAFDEPGGIALDAESNVYVVDMGNQRVQKFDANGNFLKAWGTEGSGNGQFYFSGKMSDIAVDANGNVYVADTGNDRIQKFTSEGEFITKWGSYGTEDGHFFSPSGIEVDEKGHVYVVELDGARIQKFTPEGAFIAKYGGWGTDPGQMRDPTGIAIDSNTETIYISDSGNDRLQVISKDSEGKIEKAIILAGGGPYSANTLWDATQMCANHACRALLFQGYDKESIYYLSADTDLDLDGNGILDDVDADATNANLQYAIQTWARDADELFIYMVDHGGNGTFRMGETELLYARDLDTWLDSLQQTLTGPVTMVYDACESGSFLPHLLPPTGKQRILATSASPGEESIFVGNGTVSFSFLFWGHMFNGERFYDAFVSAKKSVSTTYRQNSLLDANGNGIANEKTDKDLASLIRIGNETKSAGDVPVIGSVSPPQDLENSTTAPIYADQVVDADGISRVWAVITPPGYSPGSSETPVTDLPTIDLTSVGNNRFEGTYTQFISSGTYNIAVFALDRKGVLSLPVQTSVTRDTSCLTVGTDLSIQVPCAEYNGSRYSFLLDFYRHPDDPPGFYWELVMGTLSAGEADDCISIDPNLTMAMPCVCYDGVQYGFTLNFYQNPYDPSGLYWEMNKTTLVVK